VAIVGRTPEACFNEFRAHVNPLLVGVLGSAAMVVSRMSSETKTEATLRFPANTIPLTTRLGVVHFFFGHDLFAEKHHFSYRLRTRQYSYRIQCSPGFGADTSPLLRWEYRNPSRRGVIGAIWGVSER
jgi:hypothetical protein